MPSPNTSAPLVSTPLVSTGWLAARLADPALRIVDATVHLEPKDGDLVPRSGRTDYEAEHVPGAVFLDLISELSDRSKPLAFTRPTPGMLAETLSRVGIDRDHHVVCYGLASDMWATRLWWVLRAAGLERVSLLDGGLSKWKRESRPVCSEPCSYPTTEASLDPDESLWASLDEVERAVGAGATCTLNALPRAIHRGEAGLRYERLGHIAGSENVPFSDLIDPKTGTFVEPPALRLHFDEVGALAKDRVITYCGGGIAATLNAFALRLVGHPNVAVYDGSLNEWSREERLPMETGD